MRTDEILRDITNRSDLDEDEARRTLEATLEALGYVLHEEEASNVSAQLPADLSTTLDAAASERRDWGAEEFVAFVSEQTGEDDVEATRNRIGHALAALRAALSEGEFTDMLLDLPGDVGALLPT